MKRQSRNNQTRVSRSPRNLRVESLEDRRLLTVAAEFAPMPQQAQLGSEHFPPQAEIAVEKATADRHGIHNNGAFRDLPENSSPNHDVADFGAGTNDEPAVTSLKKPGNHNLSNIAVEKLFNRLGLQNRNSIMDPNDCPDVIDGLESAGIEADQSAGRMFHDYGLAGCNTMWVKNGCRGTFLVAEHCNGESLSDDATSDPADDDYVDAADSSESTDDTSNSLMIDDDDPDDEAPGLPGEDGILDPDPGNGRMDPAETAGADGDKIWDAWQGRGGWGL